LKLVEPYCRPPIAAGNVAFTPKGGCPLKPEISYRAIDAHEL